MENNKKEEMSDGAAWTLFGFILLACIVLGMTIGYYAIPHSQEDIEHTTKYITDIATTTVSITQEQKDCEKQGAEFAITPHITPNVFTLNDFPSVDYYKLTCTIPSKVLSSVNINKGF